MEANTKKCVIIGAGGAARELHAAILRKSNTIKQDDDSNCQYDCLGFLQDPEYASRTTQISGYPPIIGSIHGHVPNPEFCYFLGVGDPTVRFRLAALFKDYWDCFPSFIESYIFGNMAKIITHYGVGCNVHSMIISNDVQFGNFVFANDSYSIGHDAIIGDYCEIGAGVAIGGGAIIEEGVFISPNCTIGPRIKVGAWSKISANTSVLKDVPPYSLVVGVPGKIYPGFYSHSPKKD